eukprot:11068461-Lingulodinium_polyedra.AAC.1
MLVMLPRIARHEMLKRGMQLNWEPHKTAVMPVLAGPGKRRAWAQIASIDTLAVVPGVTVHLTRAYKHLGSMLCADV